MPTRRPPATIQAYSAKAKMEDRVAPAGAPAAAGTVGGASASAPERGRDTSTGAGSEYRLLQVSRVSYKLGVRMSTVLCFKSD